MLPAVPPVSRISNQGRTTSQPAHPLWPCGHRGHPRFEPNQRFMTGGHEAQIPFASPSVLAPREGLSVSPKASRTGSLGQVASPLTDRPCTSQQRNRIGVFLSDVPPGCPKGLSSDHHWFAETRKGVPTNEGRHAQCASFRPAWPVCQGPCGGKSRTFRDVRPHPPISGQSGGRKLRGPGGVAKHRAPVPGPPSCQADARIRRTPGRTAADAAGSNRAGP